MRLFSRLFQTESPQAAPSQYDLHRAAAALLMEVARTDGKVDEREKALLIKAVHRHWQLEQTEMEDLVEELHQRVSAATDLFEFTLPLRENWDPESRVQLIYAMWAIAAADGEADVYEEQLIRRVADLLYVSHGDFIRAKLAVVPR